MYKLVIIGYGSFPEGCKSALSLITGRIDEIHVAEYEGEEHSFLEKLKALFREHRQMVFYADVTGGLPQQLAFRMMMQEKVPEKHVIISGASFQTLINICLLLFYEPSADVLFKLVEMKEKEGSHCFLFSGYHSGMARQEGGHE
ncbi:hypothetical protein LRR81_16310 [Metabacillus sp. GX 13764]|uniref:hypothetical protein n=1 Tax=Metabacillus kandeliae TaxID=2900151 RepID=UPI001E395393|nr:hypothetical protein [Metabacillus kandeliae]MCD7035809.1 hypothetical protein [Metabacillus kandeliae]